MSGAVPLVAAMPRRSSHRWKVLVAFSGIPTTAVLMRSDYHLDNAGLGLALGVLGLGIAVSELPWGLATDRFGDRRVLLAGLGSTAAALAILAICAAPSAWRRLRPPCRSSTRSRTRSCRMSS